MRAYCKKSLILAVLGIVLIASAVGMVVFQRISITTNQQTAAEIVQELKAVMPTPKNVVPDNRSNPQMSVFELEGTDFIGVLDIPAFERELPIASEWDSSRVDEFPHRFFGSCYDSTIIIGGSDSQGQLDFSKNISNGDKVFLTTINGDRFTYAISSIERTKDVSFDALSSLDTDLVIFLKNTYSFDYTIIICNNKKALRLDSQSFFIEC